MNKSTKIAIAVGGTITFVGVMASLSEDPMTQEASQVSVNGPTTEATVVETPVVTEAPETTQAPPPITAPQVVTTEVTLNPEPALEDLTPDEILWATFFGAGNDELRHYCFTDCSVIGDWPSFGEFDEGDILANVIAFNDLASAGELDDVCWGFWSLPDDEIRDMYEPAESGAGLGNAAVALMYLVCDS